MVLASIISLALTRVDMSNNYSDGIIDSWAKQAMEDMGTKSWRDIDTNSLLLIIYAVQKAAYKKFTRQVTKPLWWLLATVVGGVIYMIIEGRFGF